MNGTKGLAIAIMLTTTHLISHAQDESTRAPASTVTAAALGLKSMTTDQSRQALFQNVLEYAKAQEPNEFNSRQQEFDLSGPFAFPTDARYDSVKKEARTNSYFGIDISHYTPDEFPIEQLRARSVLFLYMKATQGKDLLDPKFARFWGRAGKLEGTAQVHRGAYHFLTCGDPKISGKQWGEAQAATFIKVIRANGGLKSTDMPPVVDLEWDKASSDGPDRWKSRSATEIIAMVNAYQATVQAELKRAPAIYTARAWWRERMGDEALLEKINASPIWLADYSKDSRASELPKSINGKSWTLWQFTDSAKMQIGFPKGFDASIYKGDLQGFYSSLGVEDFQ